MLSPILASVFGFIFGVVISLSFITQPNLSQVCPSTSLLRRDDSETLPDIIAQPLNWSQEVAQMTFKAVKKHMDKIGNMSKYEELYQPKIQKGRGNPKTNPQGRGSFNALSWVPVTYPFDSIEWERIGEGDGGKWLHKFHLPSNVGCIIYSLGSNGNDQFEKRIHVRLPNCQIHIFDCFRLPKLVAPPIYAYPWCLGGKDSIIENRQFYRLKTIMNKLGHSQIHLLKMDIEFFEWDVFPELITIPSYLLPEQVIFELHMWRNRTAIDAVKLFSNLVSIGYHIAYKELNSGMNSEFTLIHE